MKNNTILIGTIICSIFTIHLDNSCGLSQAKIEDTCFNTGKAQQAQEREIKTAEAIINSQPATDCVYDDKDRTSRLADSCLHGSIKEEIYQELSFINYDKQKKEICDNIDTAINNLETSSDIFQSEKYKAKISKIFNVTVNIMFTLEKYHDLLKWDQCEKFAKEISDKAQYILAITKIVKDGLDEHQYDTAIKKIDKTVDDMEKLWKSVFNMKINKN